MGAPNESTGSISSARKNAIVRASRATSRGSVARPTDASARWTGPFNAAAPAGTPKDENARGYLTWTGFERFTSWLDVYHDFVFDFVGAAGPQLTRLDIFATARLPRFFSILHPRTLNPVNTIVLGGVILAAIAGTAPLAALAQLVNAGTLTEFILVCVGVVILRGRPGIGKRSGFPAVSLGTSNPAPTGSRHVLPMAAQCSPVLA